MRVKGYGGYRGRSPLKSFLKILAIVLAALLLAAAAAIAYLQQFLVVSNDGVRLELPFFHTQADPEPSQDPQPSASAPEVVVVTPTPEPEPEAVSPVAVEEQALYDGTVAEQVAQAGGDCALLNMKTEDGMLHYVSAIDRAVSARVSADDPQLNEAIRKLNAEEGMYTIARVCCFKDHVITDYDRSLAIFTNSGYRWTDPEGIRWISPTNPDVRQYLTEICAELAQLGFDEIMLDYAGYPSEGHLNYIKKGEAYDSTQFASVIQGFYSQVLEALEPYDTVLSVVTTQTALDGEDALTGQTPEDLKLVQRCWLTAEDGSFRPVEDGEGAE